VPLPATPRRRSERRTSRSGGEGAGVLPVLCCGGGGRAEAAGVPDMPGGVRARGDLQRVSGMPALVPPDLHWDMDEERQEHLPVVQS
jgi:hypothetical protein